MADAKDREEAYLITVSAPNTVTFTAVRYTSKEANEFAKSYKESSREVTVVKYLKAEA